MCGGLYKCRRGVYMCVGELAHVCVHLCKSKESLHMCAHLHVCVLAEACVVLHK